MKKTGGPARLRARIQQLATSGARDPEKIAASALELMRRAINPRRALAHLGFIGGEGGIRTPDTVARMPHFECGAFNRSATSPEPKTT
jgi:hypothetical protein